MSLENHISRNLLEKAFPFYFCVNKELQVIGMGKSIAKLLPKKSPFYLHEIGEIIRPSQARINFEDLKNREDELILLELKLETGKVLFKSQLVHLGSRGEIVFIGSPYLLDPEELAQHNILLTDFAINDSSADTIQVLQINKMVNNDLNELNDRLIQKERMYRSIVNQATEIIFTTNLEGVIQFINEVGKEFIPIEDGADVNFYELVEEKFVSEIRGLSRALLKEELQSYYVEFQLIGFPDLWIGQNVIAIEEGGKFIGFQAIGRNVTERKQYEKLILEEKERAEQAAKAKSRFLANMSHEIRTPLNGIIGLTELLLKSSIDAKQEQYLKAIVSSSETLMVVINDILDISKIEAGKIKLQSKLFCPQTAVSQVIDMMSVKALEKGIELKYTSSRSLPPFLVGDEARLNQILYNIIGNAIKFTKKGSVSVDVFTTEESKDLAEFHVIIEDTGVGISKEDLPSIFSAFSQLEQRNETQKGTGLGLTISRRLIELQSGNISVQSTLGKGTTFEVMIPFKKPHSKQIVLNSEPIKKVSIEGLKILLVEDNPVNQMVTADLLCEFGADVKVAGNGQQGLEDIETYQPDVVLMDMQMPVLNGYEAIKTLRKNEKHEKLPVIAFTAQVTEGEIEKCISAGADDYLSKPFKGDDLVKKISQLLKVKELESNHASVLSQSSCYDSIQLRQMTMGKDNLMLSVLTKLPQQLENDFAEIETEYRANNFLRMRALVHRCKPNIKMICNAEIAEVVDKLESACLEENKKDIEEHYKVLKSCKQDLLLGIEKEFTNLKNQVL